MFINNVSGDANNTEGIGSIYSFKLISYALSQIYKIGFVNNEMKNIVGGNYMGMSKKDYDKAVNDYFDLKYKNLKQNNCYKCTGHNICQKVCPNHNST